MVKSPKKTQPFLAKSVTYVLSVLCYLCGVVIPLWVARVAVALPLRKIEGVMIIGNQVTVPSIPIVRNRGTVTYLFTVWSGEMLSYSNYCRLPTLLDENLKIEKSDIIYNISFLTAKLACTHCYIEGKMAVSVLIYKSFVFLAWFFFFVTLCI